MKNEVKTNERCCGACKHMLYEDTYGYGVCYIDKETVHCSSVCENGFVEREEREPRIISVYISGKVSGLPLDKAKRRFSEAAEECRLLMEENGYEKVKVVNPLDIPAPIGLEWADYMLMDLQLLRHCDAIMMMPGWEESVGAVVEHTFCVGSGKAIYYLEEKACT